MAESVSNICRICLQQVEKNVKFCFLNNDNGLMLQSKLLDFLPEIALNATQNPIICNRCTITIDGIHEFKQLCLPTESIIKDLRMQQKPFEDVLNYVKKETVYETFKEELVEDTITDEHQIVDDDCLQVNTDLPVCIEAPTKPLPRHVHSHRRQLQKIRQFKCDECSYTTPNIYSLTAHKKIHLKTESIIKDSQMQQKLFEDVLNYVKKDTVHETFKEELVEDTTIKDEPQIVDDSCLQVNMDLPVCIESPTKPLFYCYTCNYNTDTKSNLIQHVHTHRDFSSVFKHNLTSYVICVHNRERLAENYKCGECNYSSESKRHLKRHVSRMHNTEKLGMNYKCDECNYSSVFEHNLKTHVIRMHDREKLGINYKCDECDYSSMFKLNLNNHVYRMHNTKKLGMNYKCDECNYSSMIEHNFKCHVNRMHDSEKLGINYKCGECDYSSNFKHYLNRHVSRMHNREKLGMNYKCGECDYSSVLKENLKKHVFHMHNREKVVKNHKCSVCDYVTNSKTCIVAHIRSHTGEKPYKCNICDYRFTQNSNLKAHLNTHASEKSFKCELCSYASNQRRLLKHHQQRHLKNPVLDCDKRSFKTA